MHSQAAIQDPRSRASCVQAVCLQARQFSIRTRAAAVAAPAVHTRAAPAPAAAAAARSRLPARNNLLQDALLKLEVGDLALDAQEHPARCTGLEAECAVTRRRAHTCL